jgi:hypothetical protein
MKWSSRSKSDDVKKDTKRVEENANFSLYP